MLKSVWDTIDLVKSSFSDWNTTLWRDINVDQMELDCRKFVKVRHLFMTPLFFWVLLCVNFLTVFLLYIMQ